MPASAGLPRTGRLNPFEEDHEFLAEHMLERLEVNLRVDFLPEAECRTLRERVGVIDISNFAKYRIAGVGAGDWLDRVVANRVPRKRGRTCLAPMLGQRGGIAGDFTITCLGDDDYWMIGSGMARRSAT